MGHIYITRHGETEWNTIRKMQGQGDSPLTELGEKQAIWLAERLSNEKIDIIYSSSLERAMKTANIIKGDRQIDIIPTDGLKEIFLGSWQGRLIIDVEQEFPEKQYHFWNEPKSYVPIDGENFEELVVRAKKCFDEIIEKHPTENVLIVAHAITIKALLNYIQYDGDITYLWEGPHIKPTSLTKLKVDDGKISVELIADISHHQEFNTTGGWFIEEE